jgi:hypothetical protein
MPRPCQVVRIGFRFAQGRKAGRCFALRVRTAARASTSKHRSRIIASSLARNSTARAPCSTRGILKTSASRRLCHSTNPSRSYTKIVSRSPRRGRNTNRQPLCGFSPIIAFTRSASRSNPQRMSVASLAIQIRAHSARSIGCKLGSPITPPPATVAPAPHRILASRLGSGRSAVGFQNASRKKSALSVTCTSKNRAAGLSRNRFFHAKK